jgi:hypothetical protein
VYPALGVVVGGYGMNLLLPPRLPALVRAPLIVGTALALVTLGKRYEAYTNGRLLLQSPSPYNEFPLAVDARAAMHQMSGAQHPDLVAYAAAHPDEWRRELAHIHTMQPVIPPQLVHQQYARQADTLADTILRALGVQEN